jgi:S-adenosyl methyltransferase
VSVRVITYQTYDYRLGGKDNFAADRVLVERLIEALPDLLPSTVENKEFLARAVTWAANQGIRQFIDVGCGMPTSPTTGEVAREVHADARVAYIDSDPVVVSHHLDACSPGVTVVDGDVRDVPGVLARVSEGVDLSQPACLIMAMLLHFFDVPDAQDLVARYVAALAPGPARARLRDHRRHRARPRLARQNHRHADTVQFHAGFTACGVVWPHG